ncbi:MAG: hypothetical protein DHS20C05_10590 [Hyphococcus sp.]|nr:MAG: hypothetical protein DHS20C05_10590 [Marinicaulis sp.]
MPIKTGAITEKPFAATVNIKAKPIRNRQRLISGRKRIANMRAIDRPKGAASPLVSKISSEGGGVINGKMGTTDPKRQPYW